MVYNFILYSAIIIIILFAILMLTIFVPKSKCYYEMKELPINLNNYTETLVNNCIDCIGLLQTDKSTVDYCIVYNNEYIKPIDELNDICPDLKQTLENINYKIYNVFITTLDKKHKTNSHKGSSTYSNNTIRCILPIIIKSENRTGIKIEGETKYFNENKWILCDNSRENYIFNKDKYNSVSLFVMDIERPKYINSGISTEANDVLI